VLSSIEPSSRRAVEPSSRRAVEPSSRRAIQCRADARSYDWFKQELIHMKVLEDGPVLHFVASLGAVSERITSSRLRYRLHVWMGCKTHAVSAEDCSRRSTETPEPD
jgi:hypothetical protein